MERIFIGALTKHGKRSKANTMFYTVMAKLSKRYKVPVGELLNRIFDIVRPVLNYSSIKKGATKYIYPRKVPFTQSLSISVRWIIQSARSRSERGFLLRLEAELNDILNGKGRTLDKRLEFHKRAVSNRFVLKNVYTRRRMVYHKYSSEIDIQKVKKFIRLYLYRYKYG